MPRLERSTQMILALSTAALRLPCLARRFSFRFFAAGFLVPLPLLSLVPMSGLQAGGRNGSRVSSWQDHATTRWVSEPKWPAAGLASGRVALLIVSPARLIGGARTHRSYARTATH